MAKHFTISQQDSDLYILGAELLYVTLLLVGSMSVCNSCWCWVRVWTTQVHSKDIKNGTYCCYVSYAGNSKSRRYVLACKQA